MDMLIFLFVLFLAFSVAAWYWGADSTERLTSCEWERRQNWHGRVLLAPHSQRVFPSSSYGLKFALMGLFPLIGKRHFFR
jgi:hypothetical protein